MSAEFDPYHKWLAIPPELQPPNHYRLLGIELFESDLDVIEVAADQRMAYLQGLASGEYGELSRKLLKELATARACLMDSDDKEAYDAKLKHEIASPERVEEQSNKQLAESEEAGGNEAHPDSPPADDEPAPPPVAAAPPVPEPDGPPPAIPKPPPAPPAPRANAADKTTAAEPPAKPEASRKEPPPVRANPASASVAPVVSVSADKPTYRARQLRKKRGNPALVAAGSVAAVVTLLAVIYFATGQWKSDGPTELRVSQGTSHTGQRSNDRLVAEKPVAKTNAGDAATSGDFVEPAGQQNGPNGGFPGSVPAGASREGSQETPAESPLQGNAPFDEAMAAITNGEFDQARTLLERVLQSPDSQQRTWARKMIDEVDLAISDYRAQESLESLPDGDLELIAKGEALVNIQDFQFSYPALGERFQQTLKKNAPVVLERRRAKPADVMAAKSDRPSDDAPPRVKEPPVEPKITKPATPTDPAELLESLGLRKREELWLLEDGDELAESVAKVKDLERSSRAADTARLKAIDKNDEFAEQVTMAERTGRIGIIEEAQRRLNEVKRESREVATESMKARSQLIIASLQAAHRAESMASKYRELADDPHVQRALEQLGRDANRLGPTPALERNLERVQENDKRLLTAQVMGFFGGEKEDIFIVDVIVNDQVSALFALRPRAEFSLVPEQVLREAGIRYDAEWKVEKKANGVEFLTNPVVIPSLRLGKFVSSEIEAFVLPADVRNLKGFLADNAFPNFRIDFKPGESVARLRAVR